MERDNRRFTRLAIGGRSGSHSTDSYSCSTDRVLPTEQPLPKPPEVDFQATSSRVDQTIKQPPSNSEVIHREIKTSYGKPWEYYIKSPIEFLDLSGRVRIARKRTSPSFCVGVRRFPKQNGDEIMARAFRFDHHNIASAFEAFVTDSFLYMVFEEAVQGLDHLVQSPIYPSCEQLAVILGQVSVKSASGDCMRLTIENRSWTA
ncbi:hypothetical protein ACHAO7_011402 [Fusarium culmorum]